MERGIASRLAPYVLVALTAFFSHASYIDNGFAWLDHGDIEQATAVRAPGEWGRLLLEPYGRTAFYRPVVAFAHSVDAAVYGGRAFGFHLTNVLLHMLVGVATLAFLRRYVGFNAIEATVGACVVAVHPLSWLPAGAISYRPELIVTLFVLLTLASYVRARASGGVLAILWTCVCFGLALLSKETAIAWVPALAGVWELRARRSGAARVRAPLVFGMAAVVVAYAALRAAAVPRVWGSHHHDLPLSAALGTRLAVLGDRLLELIVPLRPGLSDAARVVELGSAAAVIPLFVVCVAAWLALRDRLGSSFGVALVFLALALAPALNVVPLPRFSSPHYGYFASVGVGMLVACGWRRVRASPPAARAYAVGFAAWFVVAAYATATGGARFHDDVALFEPEVARDPNFREGRFYLARGYKEAGDEERAAEQYEAVLDEPDDVLSFVDSGAALMNYGSLRYEQKRYDEAEALLARASEKIHVGYRLASVAAVRAMIARSALDFAAVERLLTDERFDLDSADPLLVLADAQSRLGHVEQSIRTLERAIALLHGERRAEMEAILAAQKELFDARSR